MPVRNLVQAWYKLRNFIVAKSQYTSTVYWWRKQLHYGLRKKYKPPSANALESSQGVIRQWYWHFWITGSWAGQKWYKVQQILCVFELKSQSKLQLRSKPRVQRFQNAIIMAQCYLVIRPVRKHWFSLRLFLSRFLSVWPTLNAILLDSEWLEY